MPDSESASTLILDLLDPSTERNKHLLFVNHSAYDPWQIAGTQICSHMLELRLHGSSSIAINTQSTERQTCAFPQHIPKTNILSPLDIRQESENPVIPIRIFRSLDHELQGIQKTNKIISHQLRSQNTLLVLLCVFRLDQPGILLPEMGSSSEFLLLLGVSTSVSPGPALNSRL